MEINRQHHVLTAFSPIPTLKRAKGVTKVIYVMTKRKTFAPTGKQTPVVQPVPGHYPTHRPSLLYIIIIIIIIIITLYTRRRHLHVLFLLNIYLSISVFSVTPVTGSQSLFAIVAGLLLLQVLNSSVSSLFPIPFPTSFRVFIFFFFFLPATRSLFA
jgi:hypothetical protein